MANIDEVIEGLKRCTENAIPNCNGCPYSYHCEEGDTWVIKDHALELLKAQERTTKPKIHNSTVDTWYYVCDDCDYPISPGDHYCRNCGKKIVWGTFTQS